MEYSYRKRLLRSLLKATTLLTVVSVTQPVSLVHHLVAAQEVGQTVDTVEPVEPSSSDTAASEVPRDGTDLSDSSESENPASSSSDVAATETEPSSELPKEEEENAGQVATFSATAEKVYMSEKMALTETLEVGDKVLADMVWTLDGKPLDQWKTWDLQKGDFLGGPFIKVKGEQSGTSYQLTVELEALFGTDLSLRTPSNIRRAYRHYIKDYVLKGVSGDGKVVVEKTLTFRPYESFRTYDEMQAEIDETVRTAAGDRLVQMDVIGTSAENRPIKMAIVAKDQASVDKYLNETTPLMLTQPDQMLKLLESGQFDYKLPILINNTHADEQPGIDIITSLFNDFAKNDVISFQTTDAAGNPVTKTLPVASLLDRFVFLFNFTENPDGDVHNLRSLVNGLDPNRDAGFQVNPETKAIVKQIHKWNPISILDIHGFVKEFLIEPATPPHDPNFEYDLLEDLMLENAHEMGRAGVANSKYSSYVIPKIDWGSGWDDSFSGYTAVYGMYHGILGHTIEIPETNQDSFKAGYFATLGGIDYLTSRPDALMKTRLTYYSRGVNKVEDPKAEEPLVGPDGKVVGRVKKDQPKFFPDYYVIPMSLDKDNDLGEAFKMIDYFKRNGVQVYQLSQDTDNFKKGDLVVDMAQAKRGFANHVLYSGSDESEWPAMYAELVVNFPDMKGFKAIAIFGDQFFAGKLTDVTWTQAPRQDQVANDVSYHFVANNSLSAVQAVNKAIRAGKEVYLTEDGFVMETAVFSELLKEYPIHGEPLVNKKPVGEPLKAMKVYAPSHSYAWAGDFLIRANAALALEQMGFDLVDNPLDADAIVLESRQFDASVFGKKPVLVLGGSAMQQLEQLAILPGFDAEQFRRGGSHEGLMRVHVDDQDPLASGYAANDLFYSNSGNWIEGVPADFRTLVRVKESDFYIAGWWPGHEQLAGKTMAIAGTYEGQPLTIYAGNPANKLHPVRFFRWISNSVFGTKLAELQDLPQDPPKDEPKDEPKDQPKDQPKDEPKDQPKDAPKDEPKDQLGGDGQTPPSSGAGGQVAVKPKGNLPKTGQEESLWMVTGLLLLGMSAGYVARKKRHGQSK